MPARAVPMIQAHELRHRARDVAHFKERLFGRWMLIGWTVENIRSNVGRDTSALRLMMKEANL